MKNRSQSNLKSTLRETANSISVNLGVRSEIEGFIDFVESRDGMVHIGGWVSDFSNPGVSIAYVVRFGDLEVFRGIADQFRSDLGLSKGKNANYGFQFSFPSNVKSDNFKMNLIISDCEIEWKDIANTGNDFRSLSDTQIQGLWYLLFGRNAEPHEIVEQQSIHRDINSLIQAVSSNSVEYLANRRKIFETLGRLIVKNEVNCE